MAEITGQEQQRAATHSAHQRIRAALLKEPDQTPEQDEEPIRVREAEVMHFDHTWALVKRSLSLSLCSSSSKVHNTTSPVSQWRMLTLKVHYLNKACVREKFRCWWKSLDWSVLLIDLCGACCGPRPRFSQSKLTAECLVDLDIWKTLILDIMQVADMDFFRFGCCTISVLNYFVCRFGVLQKS